VNQTSNTILRYTKQGMVVRVADETGEGPPLFCYISVESSGIATYLFTSDPGGAPLVYNAVAQTYVDYHDGRVTAMSWPQGVDFDEGAQHSALLVGQED